MAKGLKSQPEEIVLGKGRVNCTSVKLTSSTVISYNILRETLAYHLGMIQKRVIHHFEIWKEEAKKKVLMLPVSKIKTKW